MAGAFEPEMIEKYGKWYKIDDIPEEQKHGCKVIYCFPRKSREDTEQYSVVKDYPNFISFGIVNGIHGVSIGAYNLERLFKQDVAYLQSVASPRMTLAKFTYLINDRNGVLSAYKKAGQFYVKRLFRSIWNCLKKLLQAR